MRKYMRRMSLAGITALALVFSTGASAVECKGGLECHVVVIAGVPITYCKASISCAPTPPPPTKEN